MFPAWNIDLFTHSFFDFSLSTLCNFYLRFGLTDLFAQFLNNHLFAQVRKDFYSVCTFLAMILYWALLMDLAIFSMRISAYVLVCGRVTGEVALFLSALALLLLASLSESKSGEFSIRKTGRLEYCIKSLYTYPVFYIIYLSLYKY